MWLDRFERINGQLRVVGIDRTGHIQLLVPEQMYKSRLAAKRNSETITLKTSFCDWKRATACEYTAAFGVNSDVTENHEVYVVEAEHTRVLIPTWELQRTLLGAPTTIARYVYAPNGLARVCAPIIGDEDFRIEQRISRKGTARTTRSPQFLNRLEWFYAYPSAYRAWHSIYRLSRSGKIAIELPAAKIVVSAHGKYVADTFYAHGIDILELSPVEAPMEWAKTAKHRYDFASHHDRVLIDRQTKDARIRPIADRWELTDHEWETIEKIVSHKPRPDRPGRPSRYELRNIANGIIVKMGTGRVWNEPSGHHVSLNAIKSLYRRLKADGRWEQIAEFLAETRPHI